MERKINTTRLVKLKSKSLVDFLDENNAPSTINFLFMDTEGSEYAILTVFDFNKYKTNVICVKHNNNVIHKEKISKLFNNKGYSEIVFESNSIDSFFKLL